MNLDIFIRYELTLSRGDSNQQRENRTFPRTVLLLLSHWKRQQNWVIIAELSFAATLSQKELAYTTNSTRQCWRWWWWWWRWWGMMDDNAIRPSPYLRQRSLQYADKHLLKFLHLNGKFIYRIFSSWVLFRNLSDCCLFGGPLLLLPLLLPIWGYPPLSWRSGSTTPSRRVAAWVQLKLSRAMCLWWAAVCLCGGTECGISQGSAL